MKKVTTLMLLICILSTTSCLPVAFTAGAVTTVASSKDRSFGTTLDDITISTKLKKEFLSKGFKALYTKISAEVFQGRVLLTGTVESEDDIITAVEIAWSIKGVKEVINELKTNETSSKFDAAQYAKDSWITWRIKTSLFFKRHIKFVNYTVVTVKNVVYLFGIARTQDELEEVSQIASQVAGVEKVVSYVHLNDTSSINSVTMTRTHINEVSNDDDM